MSEVLNHDQIKKKITRMAYEIYERNLGSGAVVFAGISGMGKTLAGLLAAELQAISNLKIEEVEILLDKSNLAKSEVELSSPIELEGKTLLIVDDVLNTGKTLAYAMKPFWMSSCIRWKWLFWSTEAMDYSLFDQIILDMSFLLH
jgi:pyrimidine operon attenuation protein/uracil phosphoribosyltransferase